MTSPKTMARCARCGASIQWHRTAAGKSMPLDFGANPEGNCTIIDNVLVVLGKEDPRRIDGSVVLLMPHWATCKTPPKKKP